MMATSPHQGQRLAAPNPAPPPPAPHIDPNGRLTATDWHLLFDAVKGRLLAAAGSPDTTAQVVRECVEALDYLQGMLEPPARRDR
jgi:hypothetical protein